VNMAAQRRNSKRLWLLLALLAVLAGLLAYLYWPDEPTASPSASSSQPAASPPPPAQKEPTPLISLQPTVDAWADKQSGRASVAVYDLANSKTVASLDANRQYFTASLYKLYVAYVGYQKIDDGTYNADEPYLGGYTRAECLDKMIRESYSPCGEKWWNELGKQAVTAKMRDYGLKNTSLPGLETSAGDAAAMLRLLYKGTGLTKASRAAYLDSMEDQPALYRRGLPSGFSKSTVYDKVGWNGQVEWHDAAIITLPGGRSYVISVLSQNVGSSQIAALGRAIETRLTQ
jgi:beta-lactamase class A